MDLLEEANFPEVTVYPCSPFVNLLPLGIKRRKNDGSFRELTEEEKDSEPLAPYHLRSDKITIDGTSLLIYKLCIMPQTYPFIGQFVEDIRKILNNEVGDAPKETTAHEAPLNETCYT